MEAFHFLNGTDSIKYTEDFPPNSVNYLYVKYKDGSWNIFKIDRERFFKQGLIGELVLTQALSENVDEIDQNMTYFYKDGLMGIYPTMKRVKYVNLGLEIGYLRYEDKSGIKGWLNGEALEELPDL